MKCNEIHHLVRKTLMGEVHGTHNETLQNTGPRGCDTLILNAHVTAEDGWK